MKKSTLALLSTIACLTTSSPAMSAEWRRADTPRFIVYSDGDERSLRESALKLELYESALRSLHGMDPGASSPQRIAIYLVRDGKSLKAVAPQLRDEVAGFYQATNDDIFAMAIRERRDMGTLLHEYAHHFMIGSFATGFPAWFVEGYAEYFSSADLQPTRMVIGNVNRDRGDWLSYSQWLPLDLVLTRRPFEFQDPKAVSMYYAQSWLLTHWFLSTPARMPMLFSYLENLKQGMEPVAAMESATGMSVTQLERQQKNYARQRLMIKIITGDQFPQPSVQITELPQVDGDMLLSGLRLSSARSDDTVLLADIRQRAAAFAGQRAADLLLARAELRLGDKAQARLILERMLENAPDDIDALRLLGETLANISNDNDNDDPGELLRLARTHLARAYQLRPNDYRTLTLLAETRQGAPNFPTDNDMETLLAALELAPQATGVRIFAAQVHARRKEYAQAIDLLQPLAASPHPDGATTLSRTLIERYRGQQDNGSASSPPLSEADALPIGME